MRRSNCWQPGDEPRAKSAMLSCGEMRSNTSSSPTMTTSARSVCRYAKQIFSRLWRVMRSCSLKAAALTRSSEVQAGTVQPLDCPDWYSFDNA